MSRPPSLTGPDVPLSDAVTRVIPAHYDIALSRPRNHGRVRRTEAS
jgi:hypothetical protein